MAILYLLKQKITTVIISLVAFLFVLFVLMHGYVYHFSDEAFVVYPASRVAAGEVLYKDTIVTYTPGAIWLIALAFKILGISIFSERVLMALVSLLGIFGIVKLIQKWTEKILPALLAAGIYFVWGPLQINFPAPGMFALVSGIYLLLCLWYADKKNQNIYYFTAGMLAALTFFFKQNFGVAAFITAGSYFVFSKRRSFAGVRWFFSGAAGVSLAIGLYLFFSGSLFSFLEVFYTYTVNKYLIERITDTPIAGIIYLWPIIVSGWFIWKFRMEKEKYFIGVFGLTYGLLGIRPVADYVHLVPLIGLTGIPLAMMARGRNIIFCLMMGLLVVGLSKGIFGGYYKWGPPLIQQSYFSSSSKTMVWTTKELDADKKEFVADVQKYTRPGEEIYVNYYSPWVYFLSGHGNATRFEYVTSNVLTKKWEEEISSVLEKKRVTLVITNQSYQYQGFYEQDYIQSHYHPVKETKGYVFWIRNNES